MAKIDQVHTDIQKLTHSFVLNRPKSDHCLALSVSHSLLVEKLDMLDLQSYYMDFSKILNVFVKIGTSISLDYLSKLIHGKMEVLHGFVKVVSI